MLWTFPCEVRPYSRKKPGLHKLLPNQSLIKDRGLHTLGGVIFGLSLCTSASEMSQLVIKKILCKGYMLFMSHDAGGIKYSKERKTFYKSAAFGCVFRFQGLESNLWDLMRCWETGPLLLPYLLGQAPSQVLIQVTQLWLLAG